MKKHRSIKWKLITLFTSLATSPVLILGGLVLYYTSKSFEAEINSQNLLLSKIYIQQAEKYLAQPVKELTAFKELTARRGIEVRTIILFDELLHNHEYYRKFILTDRKGYITHVFPHDPHLIGSDMSRRPFFREVTSSGKIYWSSVFISSPDDIPVTALSIPLKDYILTAYLNLNRLAEIGGEISKAEDIQVTVTDQTGTFISHSNEIKVLQREMDIHYQELATQYKGEIFTRMMNHEGQDYICHIGFIEQTGWSVMISQPFEKTYLPVKRLFWFIISLTIIIFIVSFFISYRFGSRIKSALDTFLASTRKIAEGDYGSTISGFEYAEFKALADSIYGMAQDIEERERRIIESQALFRAVFHSDAVGICILNHDFTLQQVNPKWTEITGYTLDDFKGRTLLDLLHPDYQVRAEDILHEKLSGHEEAERLEKVLLKKDGAQIWVDFTIGVIGAGQDTPHLVAILLDNTDRKKASEEKKQLEQKLQQAHKMEAVGSLAGGIAHDFNNILSAILGYAEMAQEEVTPESKPSKFLQEIRKAGNRAKDLVQQILSFSRQSDTDIAVINPERVVRDALRMLRPSLPSNIEITTNIEQDVGFVRANSAQLHQVIVNLCTNSFHAMESTGGILEIRLHHTNLTPSEVDHVVHAPPGDYVQMTIIDSGPGIPAEIQDKIFNPYYTTKEFGKGTGMGLSIVHGIVNKHGGFITLDDDHKPGASFSVYLPRLDTGEEKIPDIQTPLAKGNERILLVDDEVMLTHMGKSMLESLGYKVTTSNSSLEAIELFEQYPNSFDLLITDQTMPHMTGIELSKKILTIEPQLPIILCTGYSSVVSKQQARASGIREFIYKPFNARSISETIRNIFDGQ